MKKITLYFLLLTVLFINFSCDPEPELEDVTDVELTFKGKFGDDTFVINRDDWQYNNMDIRFDQFNFYISNVTLVKEGLSGQEETDLVEIDFVDLSFTPSEIDDAEKGFTIKISNVPVGDYDGIKIGLGVPADLNKSSWDEFGGGHPLRKVGHHWPAWESFIFSKTEANIDIDNDGGFLHKISYHTGADEAYTSKYVAKEINLSKNEIANITFEADVMQIFKDVDVIQDFEAQNLSDLELVKKIMQNLKNDVLSVK